MDVTPSDQAAPPPTGRGEGLPVDPDVVRAERVPVSPSRRPDRRPGDRRRAEPNVMWSRLLRALAHRRDVLAFIAVGGALGSLARWALAEAMPHRPDEFAWATFIENVSGCFLIGLLMVFVIEVWPPSRYVRPFLGVGILGGYTTFSTYMLDTRSLLVSGAPELACVYLFGSLAAGFSAVWLAVFAARGLVRLSRRRRHRLRDRNMGGPVLGRGGRRDAAGPGGTSELRRVGESERASRRTR